MTVQPKETCPPQIQTVLEIWQATLVEARLGNGDALSAAAMLLPYVCINICKTVDDAHDMLSATFYDMHQYIDANWDQAQAMRAAARRKRFE